MTLNIPTTWLDSLVCSVILNGEKVIPEFTGNRSTEGYIGIQNHDADSHVSFKNIMIKEKKIWG